MTSVKLNRALFLSVGLFLMFCSCDKPCGTLEKVSGSFTPNGLQIDWDTVGNSTAYHINVKKQQSGAVVADTTVLGVNTNSHFFAALSGNETHEILVEALKNDVVCQSRIAIVCPIVIDDVMMLTGLTCPGGAVVWSGVLDATTPAHHVDWPSVRFSGTQAQHLFNVDVTGNAFSKFTMGRSNAMTGRDVFAIIGGATGTCYPAPSNAPTFDRSTEAYVHTGLGFEITKDSDCSGFTITKRQNANNATLKVTITAAE